MRRPRRPGAPPSRSQPGGRRRRGRSSAPGFGRLPSLRGRRARGLGRGEAPDPTGVPLHRIHPPRGRPDPPPAPGPGPAGLPPPGPGLRQHPRTRGSWRPRPSWRVVHQAQPRRLPARSRWLGPCSPDRGRRASARWARARRHRWARLRSAASRRRSHRWNPAPGRSRGKPGGAPRSGGRGPRRPRMR